MSFPVELKYIEQTEKDLEVTFPFDFKLRMQKSNGGELMIDDYVIELFPFFDKSNKNRIGRTCNHIGLETTNAREWIGFPQNGIAIGGDGYGNLILLMHQGDGRLHEQLYFWDHETGGVEIIADSIAKIES